MLPHPAYAVLYFAATTVYSTYGSEAPAAVDSRPPPLPWCSPFIGVGGVVAVRTGRMARALGTPLVGIAGLVVAGGALALLGLGLGSSSLAVTLASAVLFGAGFMVGSSLPAIWMAQVAPDRPGDSFTNRAGGGCGDLDRAPALSGP